MNVAILPNAAAGRGRGPRVARQLRDALAADGHDARIAHESAAPSESSPLAASRWADMVLVVGGDGTLHHLLPILLDAGKPVYQAPLGTENLFAREFGMTGSALQIRRWLREPRFGEVDVARCDSRPFVIMASIGPDAGVVHRLSRRRSGPITHLSYIRPVAVEIIRPSLPRLWAQADGRELIGGRRGMLVVANSRQYALRLNPAPRADMSDGLLDLVFLPAATGLGAAAWQLACRARALSLFPQVVSARAREVVVRAAPGRPGVPPRLQVDGEASVAPGAADGALELRFDIGPRHLVVLLPPDRSR